MLSQIGTLFSSAASFVQHPSFLSLFLVIFLLTCLPLHHSVPPPPLSFIASPRLIPTSVFLDVSYSFFSLSYSLPSAFPFLPLILLPSFNILLISLFHLPLWLFLYLLVIYFLFSSLFPVFLYRLSLLPSLLPSLCRKLIFYFFHLFLNPRSLSIFSSHSCLALSPFAHSSLILASLYFPFSYFQF